MPHRLLPQIEALWRAMVALYEPVLFYVAVAASAVYATAIDGSKTEV